MRYLAATLAALVLVGTLLTSGYLYVARAVAAKTSALAPVHDLLKYQGLMMQAAAFDRPDLLPIYGSSELTIPDTYHGSNLFQKEPTGFTIYPVGRAGTTDLVFLQNFAALGHNLRGKKVVLSLSAPWFFGGGIRKEAFAGNFSPLQANTFLFDSPLSLDLKSDGARRMLRYPDAYQDDTLLRLAVQALARKNALGYAEYYTLMPLGRLHVWILKGQDAWSHYLWLKKNKLKEPPAPQPAALNWNDVLQKGTTLAEKSGSGNPFGFEGKKFNDPKYLKDLQHQKGKSKDAAWIKSMDNSPEWTDLNLTLRALKELGADVFVYSMPIQGPYYDYLGISSAARQHFYDKLRETVAPYGFSLATYEEHDEDKFFLIDSGAHLSPRGWIYVNQDLDRFMHGRLAP